MKKYIACLFASLALTSYAHAREENMDPDLDTESAVVNAVGDEAAAEDAKAYAGKLQREEAKAQKAAAADRARADQQHSKAEAELRQAEAMTKAAQGQILALQDEQKKQKQLFAKYLAEAKAARQIQIKSQQDLFVARRGLAVAKNDVIRATNARNMALKIAKQAEQEMRQLRQRTIAAKAQVAALEKPIGTANSPRQPASGNGLEP